MAAPLYDPSRFNPYVQDYFTEMQQQGDMWVPPYLTGEDYLPAQRTDEGKGVVSHVLDILGYLDRPRNALATGVSNALSDDPNKTFAGGLKEGFLGERNVSWGDIFGIPEASDQDAWGDWLAKSGGRFAADLVLDPLNLIPFLKVPKAIKGLPSYQKASEALHGSSFGRTLLHGVPAHQVENFEVPLQAAERRGKERLAPVLAAFEKGKALESGELAKLGDEGSLLGFREAFERPGGALPSDIENFYKYLHEQASMGLNKINELAHDLGLPEVERITEDGLYRYVPRIKTDQGERLLSQSAGRGAGRSALRPEEFKSRTLERWVDPEALARGELVDPGNKAVPLVSDIRQRFSPIKETPEKGFVYQEIPGVEHPVAGTQASLADLYTSGAMKPGTFVEGAAESFLGDIIRKDNQQVFLEFMKGQAGGAKNLMKVESARDLSMVPKNWREVNIPGLEGWYAPKWAATELEKTSSRLFNPETPLGMIEQAGKYMLDSELGKLVKEGTTWWKRNVLGLHPAYYIGNEVSNIPQMYLGGVHAWMIPFRKAQAIAVQTGSGGDVIRGFTNEALRDEFAHRGLMEYAGMGERAGREAIEEVTRTPRTQQIAEALPEVLQPVGKAVAYGAKKYGDLNSWLLKNVGGNIEANSRVGVAIDWLKKNVKGKPTPEDLDRAASFASNAMIDYSKLTPAEKMFQTVIPFYAWQRGILGRTLETAFEHPERLARLGRFLDTAMEPMAPYEKSVAEPWMQEQAPVTKIAGIPLNELFGESTSGMPQMLMSGRFLPHTAVEQMTKRPVDTLISTINPLLRGPAELAMNRSSFKKRPIDEISGDFPASLYNPLIGEPYELAGSRLFGQTLPASYEYAVASSPGGRTIRAVDELGRIMGLWKDSGKPDIVTPVSAEGAATEAGGEVASKAKAALLGAATGFKAYPYDVARQIKRREHEKTLKERGIKFKWRQAAMRGDTEAMEDYQEMLESWREEQFDRQQKAYSFTQ